MRYWDQNIDDWYIWVNYDDYWMNTEENQQSIPERGRAGAGSTGRDNDPDGLGDMPDSQGPFGSEPNKAQMVREPYMSPSDVSFPTAPT